MNNFGAGLKDHLLRRNADIEKPMDIYQMQAQKPSQPTRMTID
jgi:hypothetical protein